ncbi:MAG: exo-alpha-sialidase [Phycisphaeraceae bacterium]|nr:exo-alpha-sialidase [Phycisphaeraceae bacterium]
MRAVGLLIGLGLLMGLSSAAAAQSDRLPDPNSLIDQKFPDNPRKITPLAQDFVEVGRSPDPQKVYQGVPYVLALPGADGKLIGGYSMGGPGFNDWCKQQGWTGGKGELLNSVAMTSDDHGQTWQLRKRYRMSHQRAFEADGHLYILGHDDDLRIMRSDDNGDTWSDPVALSEREVWHQSSCGYWKTDTHIYIVMERRYGQERGLKGWDVACIAPVLMRGKLTDDLTRRENWTFASELVFEDIVDLDKINHVGIPFYKTDPRRGLRIADAPNRQMNPMGWLETNVVQIVDPNHVWYDPTGHTFHLISRMNTGGTNIAAISKVVENADGTMTTMLEKAPSGKDMLFVPLPGGQMKFFILYDKQTKLYWLLGSQPTDSMIQPDRLDPRRYGIPNQERHRMVLHFSRNLIDWCFAGLVAVGPDMDGARHYACMDIDGDDLVIMSRSGDQHSASAHNGNITTFHRIKNFRGLVY